MTQQIQPQTVATLRSMKRTAVIVLLLFTLSGPVQAKRVAELLDIDYQTTRKYLKELSLLGIITNTPAGWTLLQDGTQLILPASNAIYELERENIAPPLSASAACTSPSILLQEEEERTRDSRVVQCLNTLEELGITATNQVLTILKDERITPEYIDSQAERLEKENRWSTGLLLTVIKCFDPIPQGSKAQRRNDHTDGRSYINGKYSEWIKH